MTDQSPLVSIIIPTFNRANLIGETLDSIVAQTYQNWECIVTDDGSTDHTDTVMAAYVAKDSRFRYFHRPADKPKGANACRNNGLDKAQGDFIIFFDSDDLMTENHISVKLVPLLNGDYDFSITKTKYFNVENDRLESNYKYDEFEISAHNYIVQNINWLTPDTCIKSVLAKSIRFNEKLQSGQEYNYYSMLVLKTAKATFIAEYVTLRRMHDDSIRGGLKDKDKLIISEFKKFWGTYLSIESDISLETKKQLLYKCIGAIYTNAGFIEDTGSLIIKKSFKVYGFPAYNLFLMLFFQKYFNKGYYFLSRLKKNAYS